MEANRKRTRWTYAEYARLPSEGSTRHEVIDGDVVVTPAPTSTHQRIVGLLVTRLYVFAEEHGLGQVYPGPVDVLFAEGDYVQPDLLFVRDHRRGIITDRGCEGPPDLIIEITSPATASRDRGIKLDRYRLFGVPEYWIVDPDAGVVEIWRLVEGDAQPRVVGPDDVVRWQPEAGGPVLELQASELFADP